ncbi:MAG: hypothetical protein IPO63_10585 [Bacteroidetes bacterium]|nr:hypothetical protein [Bacteroidota bacterium]
MRLQDKSPTFASRFDCMEEDDDEMENMDERSEHIQQSIEKYEKMREKQERYFFDVDALVKIIDHFIERLEFEKALEVTKYAFYVTSSLGKLYFKRSPSPCLNGQ